MIPSQNENIFDSRTLNFDELAADGIGCALVPTGAARGLFRRPDLDPALSENIAAVGAKDVAMERNRVELGRDSNFVDTRIEAVADGNIDQAILSRDRHGRLRAHFCQRVQT